MMIRFSGYKRRGGEMGGKRGGKWGDGNIEQLTPSASASSSPSSPIITHHHPSSPIITHHHPSSPTITITVKCPLPLSPPWYNTNT
jgi:hypothetical protein